jgi:hypothetical protein
MFQFSITRRQPWNYRKRANNENKVEIITVTQNCVMFETKPELSAIGKNTTTITKVMELPFHQFRQFHRRLHGRFYPSPCVCKYFLDTIASSTRIPTTGVLINSSGLKYSPIDISQ